MPERPATPGDTESPDPADPGAAADAPPEPEVVDPDIDLHVPRQRRELRDAPWSVLAAISVGGAVGGAARSAVGLALPHEPGQIPWSTLAVNVSGCLLIGVLMTVVICARPRSELLRPFAGVGLLGGYTTFSAHVSDMQAMLAGGAPAAALGYIGATLVGGLAAVWAGIALTERLLRWGAPGARARAHRPGTAEGVRS